MDQREQEQRPVRREYGSSAAADSIGRARRVIDQLEARINDARRVPMSKTLSIVDAGELIDLIGQLRIVLPHTVVQAQAILDMRLARLTGLERERLQEEYAELEKTIAYLRAVLADEKMVLGIIREEILAIKAKYADERRTQISLMDGEIVIRDGENELRFKQKDVSLCKPLVIITEDDIAMDEEMSDDEKNDSEGR